MPDDGDPELLLAGLLQRVSGARAAVLLSSDGMAICECGLGADDADRLAAIASGLFSGARQAAVIFAGKDGVRQVVVEAAGLLLFAMSAGQRAVLAVFAGQETDAGVLGTAMGETIRRVQPFLTARPRIRGAIAGVAKAPPALRPSVPG